MWYLQSSGTWKNLLQLFSLEKWKKKGATVNVAGAMSPQNDDDDDDNNTINKGRYAVKQKTPSERDVSLNNRDVDML